MPGTTPGVDNSKMNRGDPCLLVADSILQESVTQTNTLQTDKRYVR